VHRGSENRQLTDGHRYCAPNKNPRTTLALFPGAGLLKIGRKKIFILHRNALEEERIVGGREGIKRVSMRIALLLAGLRNHSDSTGEEGEGCARP